MLLSGESGEVRRVLGVYESVQLARPAWVWSMASLVSARRVWSPTLEPAGLPFGPAWKGAPCRDHGWRPAQDQPPLADRTVETSPMGRSPARACWTTCHRSAASRRGSRSSVARGAPTCAWGWCFPHPPPGCYPRVVRTSSHARPRAYTSSRSPFGQFGAGGDRALGGHRRSLTGCPGRDWSPPCGSAPSYCRVAEPCR